MTHLFLRASGGVAIFGLLLIAALAGRGLNEVLAVTQGEDELQGRLLVASQKIQDPRFARTVIFLVQHSREGAIGLVINREIGKVDSAEILEGMGMKSAEPHHEVSVFYGGPVQLDHGFILHSTDFMLESSQEAGESIAWSSDPEMIKLIMENRGPESHIFALGYAGWAPSQLESEIARGDWLVVETDSSQVFSEDLTELWEKLIGEKVFRL